MLNEKPLSIEEFAKSLGVHYISIWRACRRGEIACNRVGRKYFIPRGELLRYQYGRRPKGEQLTIKALGDIVLLEGKQQISLPRSWMPKKLAIGESVKVKTLQHKQKSSISIIVESA